MFKYPYILSLSAAVPITFLVKKINVLVLSPYHCEYIWGFLPGELFPGTAITIAKINSR